MADTFESACEEADRKAATQPPDQRVVRLRRLGEPLDELERERAAAATVEALMFSLRLGLVGLNRPGAMGRLAALSEAQLREVVDRIRRFRPPVGEAWSDRDAKALVVAWSKLQ
jgi:hypothetical protein